MALSYCFFLLNPIGTNTHSKKEKKQNTPNDHKYYISHYRHDEEIYIVTSTTELSFN